MRAIAGKQGRQRDRGEIVGEILVGAARERGGDARKVGQRRQIARGVQIITRIARQRRVAVHAAVLERDEIGTDIPLLENVDLHPAPLGHLDRGAVERTAIAEQDEIGHLPIVEHAIQKARPAREAATIVDRAGKPPIDLVAAVEIDAMYAVPVAGERVAEPGEERPRKTLKEQKLPFRHAPHLIFMSCRRGAPRRAGPPLHVARVRHNRLMHRPPLRIPERPAKCGVTPRIAWKATLLPQLGATRARFSLQCSRSARRRLSAPPRAL